MLPQKSKGAEKCKFYTWLPTRCLIEILSEVFITIVLLLSWTDFYKGKDHIDVIDSFAGAARVARVARALGYRSVALDRDYHKNPRVFDFNESAGFGLLVLFCDEDSRYLTGVKLPISIECNTSDL